MRTKPHAAAIAAGPNVRFRLATLRRRVRDLLRPMARSRIAEVPVASLRCQVTDFGERQGFSGRPIDHFPPCGFFSTSLHDLSQAERDFAKWYRMVFVDQEGWRVAKRRGGMSGGSLARTVIRLFRERHGWTPTSISQVECGIIDEAIHLRVCYYLRLFESIRHHGLYPGSILPCVRGRGVYFLRDGHHRASALSALGIDKVSISVPEKR